MRQIHDSTTTLAPLSPEMRGRLPFSDEEIPDAVYQGGILGIRQALELESGEWVNPLGAYGGEVEDVDYYQKATCLPVMFFQEILASRRLPEEYDSLVPHRLSRVTATMRLHCGDWTEPNLCHQKVLSSHALSQWCGHIKTPVPYIRSLAFNARGVPEDPRHEVLLEKMRRLAAANINTGMEIREATVRGAEEGHLLIRLGEESDQLKIRAVLTDTYARFDNHALLDSIVESFPEEMVPNLLCSRFWCDGNDMLINLVIPNGWHSEPDGIWGMMICFGNSEIGARSIEARVALYEASTGITILYDRTDTQNGLFPPIRHYGNLTYRDVSEKIRTNLPMLLESSRGLMRIFRSARTIHVPNPEETLTVLARGAGLTERQGREWYRVFQARRTEPFAETAYGLLRALLLRANECEGTARESLQLIAGQILAKRLTDSDDTVLRSWLNYSGAGQSLGRRNPDIVEAFTTGGEQTAPG